MSMGEAPNYNVEVSLTEIRLRNGGQRGKNFSIGRSCERTQLKLTLGRKSEWRQLIAISLDIADTITVGLAL